jgi:hypothetical protein
MADVKAATIVLTLLLFSALQSAVFGEETRERLMLISSTIGRDSIVSVGYIDLGGSKRPFVLKSPIAGAGETWGYIIDVGNYGFLSSSKLTDDGGIVAVGYVRIPMRGFDILVLKMDSSGEVLWAYAFGGEGHDLGVDVAIIGDEIIVVGNSYSFGFKELNDADMLIMKLNASGQILDSRVIGTIIYDDFVRKVKRTMDGGLILLGETWSYNVSMSDVLLVRMDLDMNVLWSVSMGGSSQEEAFSAIEKNGGGFIIVGVSGSFPFGENDGFFLEVDEEGRLLYVKGVGWSGGDGLVDICPLDDGFLMLGYSSVRRDESDLILLEASMTGDVNGIYIVSRDGFESPHSVSSRDGKVIMASKFSDDSREGLMVADIQGNWSGINARAVAQAEPSIGKISFLEVEKFKDHVAAGEWLHRKQELSSRIVNLDARRLSVKSLPSSFRHYQIEADIGKYVEKVDWRGEILEFLRRNVSGLMMVAPFLVLFLAWALLKAYKLLRRTIRRGRIYQTKSASTVVNRAFDSNP